MGLAQGGDSYITVGGSDDRQIKIFIDKSTLPSAAFLHHGTAMVTEDLRAFEEHVMPSGAKQDREDHDGDAADFSAALGGLTVEEARVRRPSPIVPHPHALPLLSLDPSALPLRASPLREDGEREHARCGPSLWLTLTVVLPHDRRTTNTRLKARLESPRGSDSPASGVAAHTYSTGPVKDTLARPPGPQ